MEKQLMVARFSDVMDWSNIKPITGEGVLKPEGGVWSSTHLGNGESEWTRWCILNEHDLWIKGNKFILTIDENARILTFDDKENVKMFIEKFTATVTMESMFGGTWDMRTVNWSKVAECYDGIHMTHKGLCNVYPERFLGGWDMECSVWFRNVFKEVVSFK